MLSKDMVDVVLATKTTESEKETIGEQISKFMWATNSSFINIQQIHHS